MVLNVALEQNAAIFFLLELRIDELNVVLSQNCPDSQSLAIMPRDSLRKTAVTHCRLSARVSDSMNCYLLICYDHYYYYYYYYYY